MSDLTLTAASRQWSTRPADERFTSLTAMQSHMIDIRNRAAGRVVSSRDIVATPSDDHRGLTIAGKSGVQYAPSNWAFGQLAQLAGAPAGYLRDLPSELAADCVNFGLNAARDIADIGILIERGEGLGTLRAATGPRYGRIWNSDIVSGLVDRCGDGISGDWRVPGEFKRDVVVTKANTTLFAGDRDMFVFLADEKNRIEIPNRRNGQPGSLARGFFVWNSEVGSKTFGISTFLFDYVCSNRMVWGAKDVTTMLIRHTASAADRYQEKIEPTLDALMIAANDYSETAAKPLQDRILAAQNAKISDKLDAFLATRFNRKQATAMKAVHMEEEGRPIESLWDVTTAATAYARGINYQDDRVAIETEAGKILDLVTVD